MKTVNFSTWEIDVKSKYSVISTGSMPKSGGNINLIYASKSDFHKVLVLVQTAILLIIYIILGGYLFQYLEQANENNQCSMLRNMITSDLTKTLENRFKKGAFLHRIFFARLVWNNDYTQVQKYI